MRRSKEVPVTLLAAIALLPIGCRDEVRNCIDAQGRIVPDASCESPSSAGYVPYHYVYGGSSGGHIGDTVLGGSATPHFSIFRGGFGHGGSHGAGGGE